MKGIDWTIIAYGIDIGSYTPYCASYICSSIHIYVYRSSRKYNIYLGHARAGHETGHDGRKDRPGCCQRPATSTLLPSSPPHSHYHPNADHPDCSAILPSDPPCDHSSSTPYISRIDEGSWIGGMRANQDCRSAAALRRAGKRTGRSDDSWLEGEKNTGAAVPDTSPAG